MILADPIIHHPLSYTVGPLTFTGFGIAVLMAFVVAQLIGQRELTRRGYDPEPVSDMIFAAVIGGLLGAKLYYVIILRNYDALFTRGGFVFWGGLIGGMLAVMLVIWRKKIPMLRIFDVGAPAVAAAYAVGRTGCWAVGDDYGKPWATGGLLSVQFPNGAPPSTVGYMSHDFGVQFPPGMNPSTVVAVYPTQLIEVALGLLMFAILWRMRDHRHAEGWLFGVYCVLAGFERFLIEFLRAKDDRFLYGGLSTAQLIAVLFMFGGVLWMWWRNEVSTTKPGIYATSSVRPAPLSS